MDIGKAFSFMFEDPEWVKKLLIGGAILFVGTLFSWLLVIPLLAALALILGYSLTVTRNVAEGSTMPLPEWNDFGALFMKGLYALVGMIIYFLPAILLGCCLFLINTATAGILSGSSSSSSSNSGDGLATILALLGTCFGCLISLYSFVAGLTLYAPLTRFAMSPNQLSVFWDIRGNIALITRNIGSYVVALLIAWVAGIIGGLGIILCFIGLPFTQFWGTLVSAHIFGQWWRQLQAPSTTYPAPTYPSPVTPGTMQ